MSSPGLEARDETPTTVAGEARQGSRSHGLLRAASTISAFTLVSRVLGLARDVVTSHVFGTSWVGGVLQLAWMLPNMLRRLFGEGALAAAFVPAYTRRLTQGDDASARRLLASVSGTLIVFLGAVSVVVVVVAYWIPPETWGLEAAADGDPAGPASATTVGALLSELVAILFPYALPICLLGVLAGAQNALGSFAPTAAAPALLNVFGLAGLGCAIARDGDDLAAIARTVAWFLAAGGLAQLALGIVPLARRGELMRPRLPQRGDGSSAVLRAMLPTMLGMSLVQLNVFIDQGLAAWLIGPGSNFHVFLANRLLLFPHALVALSLATAVFPSLAAHASVDDQLGLRQRLDTAVGATLFLAIPATVGIVCLAGPLLDVAFVHGRYTEADAETTRWTTIALVVGLPALGVGQLAARTLIALGDPATPARIAAWLVLVNLALNLSFVLLLGAGVAGLTAATSCCTYVNALLLSGTVRRRCGRSATIAPTARRALLASLAMALVIVLLRSVTSRVDGRLATALIDLVLPMIVGIATYVAAQRALGSPELRLLVDRFRRRRTPLARKPPDR